MGWVLHFQNLITYLYAWKFHPSNFLSLKIIFYTFTTIQVTIKMSHHTRQIIFMFFPYTLFQIYIYIRSICTCGKESNHGQTLKPSWIVVQLIFYSHLKKEYPQHTKVIPNPTTMLPPIYFLVLTLMLFVKFQKLMTKHKHSKCNFQRAKHNCFSITGSQT